jgi:hypothetical protein
MKKIIFCLFTLSFITACQVVKMPQKILTGEEMALAYFLDKLAPNDPHLKGREFEVRFVVRRGGLSDWRLGSCAVYWNMESAVEGSIFKYGVFKDKPTNKALSSLKLKRVQNVEKIKYEHKSNLFYFDYFCIPCSSDTTRGRLLKIDNGSISLENRYVQLPSGSFYTMSQVQLMYVYKDVLYDRHYYFIVRNDVIKYLSLYRFNHREPYTEGKSVYLLELPDIEK